MTSQEHRSRAGWRAAPDHERHRPGSSETPAAIFTSSDPIFTIVCSYIGKALMSQRIDSSPPLNAALVKMRRHLAVQGFLDVLIGAEKPTLSPLMAV